jgi:hypothetical protein
MPPEWLDQTKGFCPQLVHLGIGDMGLDDPGVRFTAHCANSPPQGSNIVGAYRVVLLEAMV